jgi:hypothetical protein
VHERYEPPAKKSTRWLTLLAGIRADGATFIAFPSACSKRSVASDESRMLFQPMIENDIRPFTVAGAAQVRGIGAAEWVSPFGWP